MRFLSVFVVAASAIVSTLSQTIELGYPTDGAVLKVEQNFNAQVILPYSMASCIDVGIALALNSCTNGVCPQPAQELGSVLYAGPWNPTILKPGVGFYQNFTLQLSEYQPIGQAIFTLTHFCLAGAGPVPYLEYRNASVTIA
ncbi:hypothetical protein PAXINDRAFT_13875 [Paxillus involutus ATCC 200175]|uniref:Phosphatidylglycerol/phosphatidylinositol transfer protein n=1 Tax=Paxillus involutus ATCC 200175 TaxID=664439 RepID=A0A0C9TCK0_PAXIN|nr:hypothetical protein PAXINDRAFT_13875 [Paxillus involutus ATCC 200175]